MSENHELHKEKKNHILGQGQCVKYQRRLKQRPVRNSGHNSIIVSQSNKVLFIKKRYRNALGSKLQKIPIQTCFKNSRLIMLHKINSGSEVRVFLQSSVSSSGSLGHHFQTQHAEIEKCRVFVVFL